MDEATKLVLRRMLENPKFELIPLKNVLGQAKFLPDGATVSVTASPTKDMEATLDLSADLQQMGFDVVPHLSARMTKDRAHLEGMMARLDELGMTRIFLVGGDADESGEFLDSFSVLKALEGIGHGLTEIGIPSYPEGHAYISDEALTQALHDKQPHAKYLTTQMCFDASAITEWLSATRADGIVLPVTLGMPGVADRMRLLKISARIGVGGSMSFLRKNSSLATTLIRPGGYSPAELLEDLGSRLADPDLNISGIHIYTFNSCDTTEAWRQEYLEELSA